MCAVTHEQKKLCRCLELLIETTELHPYQDSSKAVMLVLQNLSLSEGEIDQVALRYVAIYHRLKKSGTIEIVATSAACQALKCALQVIEFGASYEVRYTVIEIMLCEGYVGRAEQVVRRHLGRELTGGEVNLLVEAYLRDRSTQSDALEVQLCALADRYMSYEDAQHVPLRLREFKRSFLEVYP